MSIAPSSRRFSKRVHKLWQFAEHRMRLPPSQLLLTLQASGSFSTQNFGSNRDGPLNRSNHMALPVLCGPNRCALVYSQDRQPLIELSLRVNLPVVELLQALSQVAPRAAESAPPRSSLAQQRGNPYYGSATVRKQERPSPSAWAEWYPNSEWQPAPEQPNSSARHSWEPCPPAPSKGWDQPQVSVAQREEQMQLLWAITDKTGPPHQRTDIAAPQPCAHTQRKQAKATSSPPRPKSYPKGPAVVSKANAAPSKRPPQTARGERADDSEEFDPPARPGAHPKKCPVQ